MRAMIIKRAARILPVVVCSAAFLSSCKDGKAATPDQDTTALQQQEQQLLDYMIFQVGDKLRKEAGQAKWMETVRDMRNEVEKYYDKLRETQGNSERLVRMGLFLADAASNLGAHDKAQGIYEKVSKDLEALPDDVRATIPMRRVESLMESGRGYCLMQQRKMDEALPHYEKALQLDQERYHRLVPDDKDGLPKETSEDITQAAADLLASYRCLAECQLYADDPEQARDTLMTADKVAQRMKNFPADVTLEYAHLLSTMGNLEGRAGNQEKALVAWAKAAKIADAMSKNGKLSDRAQAVDILKGLMPTIKKVGGQVQRQKAEEAEQQQEQAPTTEDIPAA